MSPNSQKANRLSYKDQRLYEILPGEIATLEKKVTEIEEKLSDSDLYINDKDKFYQLSDELQKTKQEINEKENTWLEIDMKKSNL